MQNIPKIQEAELRGKIVLIRVDHNVVKKGLIKDPHRIDASLETIKLVLNNGGKPILMSHVGRPKDKKTGKIEISEKASVQPIVQYLNNKLGLTFITPEIQITGYAGLSELSYQEELEKLKAGEVDGLYLPNTRWFAGEESKDEKTEALAKQLAELADVFVNDAFGSWQPHASTYNITKFLPSYAGLLMQKEIENLKRVLEPERPFLAVVAGSKFDTKIGSLTALLKSADHLIIGGVIYNAYLCAKYGFHIKGISDEDIQAASEFVKLTQEYPGKIVEPSFIIESDLLEEKTERSCRTHNIHDLKAGTELNYILDVSPQTFEEKHFQEILNSANTIFVNAVMGFTPHFIEGTITMYGLIDKNKNAAKLFGGGDTLQEFKNLLPAIYKKALTDDKYYFFTGGGTILKAIKEGSAFGLEPVKALME
jgi:phosphoglycerate kinase